MSQCFVLKLFCLAFACFSFVYLKKLFWNSLALLCFSFVFSNCFNLAFVLFRFVLFASLVIVLLSLCFKFVSFCLALVSNWLWFALLYRVTLLYFVCFTLLYFVLFSNCFVFVWFFFD